MGQPAKRGPGACRLLFAALPSAETQWPARTAIVLFSGPTYFICLPFVLPCFDLTKACPRAKYGDENKRGIKYHTVFTDNDYSLLLSSLLLLLTVQHTALFHSLFRVNKTIYMYR